MGLELLFMSRPVNDIAWDPVLRNCEVPRREEGKCVGDRVAGVSASTTTSIYCSSQSDSAQGDIGVRNLAYRIAHLVACLLCWRFMGGVLDNLRRAVGSDRDQRDRGADIPRMVDISGRLQSQGRIAGILNFHSALPRGAFARQWAVLW